MVMTKIELIEKYGDVKLSFSSYYKFAFTYNGIAPDGTIITTTIGGCSDEIYKLDVSSTKEETLISLDANYASFSFTDGTEKEFDERW
jgi:hypothetical protein